jgi:hypothetical protein
MKNRNYHRSLYFISALLAIGCTAFAQDSVKRELLVNVGYFAPADNLPYVLVNTKTKVEKKFQPVQAIVLNVYMDNSENLLGKVVTGASGTAKIVLPPWLQDNWKSSSTHVFMATSIATKKYDETTAEISITKAKLVIDTVPGADARSVRARVMVFNDSQWMPVKDVELKLGVKRLGGELPVSEEESYTTDSTGEVVARFKMEKLPGDTLGNIILVARIDDNDQFGNLVTELKVPWGIVTKIRKDSSARTLWATRDKAPVWLLLTAGSIVVFVWGSIVYLLWQIVRIRKLGIAAPKSPQSKYDLSPL